MQNFRTLPPLELSKSRVYYSIQVTTHAQKYVLSNTTYLITSIVIPYPVIG